MAALARAHSIDCLHDFAEDVGCERVRSKNLSAQATGVQSVAEALKHERV
jgi:hypothetical protein